MGNNNGIVDSRQEVTRIERP